MIIGMRETVSKENVISHEQIINFLVRSGKALDYLVLSPPHNDTRFKVPSDLSKSVFGSLTLK